MIGATSYQLERAYHAANAENAKPSPQQKADAYPIRYMSLRMGLEIISAYTIPHGATVLTNRMQELEKNLAIQFSNQPMKMKIIMSYDRGNWLLHTKDNDGNLSAVPVKISNDEPNTFQKIEQQIRAQFPAEPVGPFRRVVNAAVYYAHAYQNYFLPQPKAGA